MLVRFSRALDNVSSFYDVVLHFGLLHEDPKDHGRSGVVEFDSPVPPARIMSSAGEDSNSADDSLTWVSADERPEETGIPEFRVRGEHFLRSVIHIA